LKSRIVLVGYTTIALLVSLNMFVPLLIGGRWRPDFTSMWAGARAPNPYDLWAVTKTQAFMFDASKPLPFLYPPSSLPLFYPFGLLSFWPAYALWTAISVVLFWSAARQITGRAWLAFVAPPVVFSFYLGQTALMTGAAIMFAVVCLPKRPLVAGVCLGLAAALKPQTVLLAPFALMFGRHWKALGAAAVTWLLLAVSTAGLWLDWWRIVQAFPAMLDRYYPKIGNYAATPVYFAKALGLQTLPLQVAGIVLGLTVVWASFRTTDHRIRIIGLVTGTFFAVPYAMGYEVAAMVPAYLALLANGRLRSLIVGLPMFPINVVLMVPTLVASSLATLIQQRHAREGNEDEERKVAHPA
jgi:hypothetical protein